MIKIKNITDTTTIQYGEVDKEGVSKIIAPTQEIEFKTEEEIKIAKNLLLLYPNQLMKLTDDTEAQKQLKEQEAELEVLRKFKAEQEEGKSSNLKKKADAEVKTLKDKIE